MFIDEKKGRRYSDIVRKFNIKKSTFPVNIMQEDDKL
jgi:hypothetical protein